MPEFLFATSHFFWFEACQPCLETNEGCCREWWSFFEHQASQRNPFVCFLFDASLGKNSSAKAQQGEAHFVTTTAAYRSETAANLIEFHSNRVSRVVRSSLAADGCAMASAGDRILFNRVLFDALFHGRISVTAARRREMKCEGCQAQTQKVCTTMCTKPVVWPQSVSQL